MNYLLIIAATFNLLAALLHLGCILFGASWYKFFGVGDKTISFLVHKKWAVDALTSLIIILLCICAVYALSGAGLIRPLPFLKFILGMICATYILRGIIGFISPRFRNHFAGNSAIFWNVSSAICLVVGLIHLLGIFQMH